MAELLFKSYVLDGSRNWDAANQKFTLSIDSLSASTVSYFWVKSKHLKRFKACIHPICLCTAPKSRQQQSHCLMTSTTEWTRRLLSATYKGLCKGSALLCLYQRVGRQQLAFKGKRKQPILSQRQVTTAQDVDSGFSEQHAPWQTRPSAQPQNQEGDKQLHLQKQ